MLLSPASDELILEAGISHLASGCLLLAMLPVSAADHRGEFIAYGEPRLDEMPQFKITWRSGPPIFDGTQLRSTASLSTSGQRRATAKASAATSSLLSE
jgi:hypothetical protein